MTVSTLDLARRYARPAWRPAFVPGLAAAAWPKLAAAAAVLLAWHVAHAAGWWPAASLPGPGPVLSRLADDLGAPSFWAALAMTARRAAAGYTAALLIGLTLGTAAARVNVVRRAVGPALLGLQSMPSIAWFPLAIVLFQPSEPAILFVVVLGAAPAIAAGLLNGADQVPPLLVRAGRMMGAHGLLLYRLVIFPASVPAFIAGMKQGWAFAWRGLMAGELLMVVSQQSSLGVSLDHARRAQDSTQMLALMFVVFIIGATADGLFGMLERAVRARWS